VALTYLPTSRTSYSQYYTEDDKDINERIEQTYADAITISQSFWGEADIDTRFKAGDQTLWNELYGNILPSRRRQYNFNRIRRICNMIGGYQRKNRKSTIVTPQENADEIAASQYSKLMMWAMEQDNTLETISQAFDGAVTTGMNLLNVWLDFRNDPISGDLRVKNLSYNGFMIDPYFRSHDLSDASFIMTRQYLTPAALKSILPDHANTISSMRGGPLNDGKFQFMPEAFNYGSQNLLRYDEFWYQDYRSQKLLVDLRSGETMEWKGKDDDLELFLNKFPEIKSINQDIPTTKLAIRVQDRVLYNGPNPMGIDRYPFAPVLGYYEPQIPYFPWRVQGVVRGLRDAQFLYNRRKVIELDILESQINSGWKYKANALVDSRDVFLTGQGKGLAIKSDAQMSDVEPIQPAQVPGSMIELSKILGEEISQISGVNEELLGSATDDKAGILSQLRQGAGLTTLQILFDQLDESQKLLGRIFLQTIQSNFSVGKVKRIVAEEPAPQFFNKAFGKYDAAIEEGLNTVTQRQMQFAQLLQLREMGIPVPTNLLVEASTLQNKKQLTDAIAAEEKQAGEMSQLQLKMALKEAEARIRDLQSRAEANAGLGLERASRTEENRALAIERIAAAEKDRQLGALDAIKGMKELDNMDVVHLGQLYELYKSIKASETEEGTIDKISVDTPSTEELYVAAEGEPNEQEIQGNP
jgi:hypothetical protein